MQVNQYLTVLKAKRPPNSSPNSCITAWIWCQPGPWFDDGYPGWHFQKGTGTQYTHLERNAILFILLEWRFLKNRSRSRGLGAEEQNSKVRGDKPRVVLTGVRPWPADATGCRTPVSHSGLPWVGCLDWEVVRQSDLVNYRATNAPWVIPAFSPEITRAFILSVLSFFSYLNCIPHPTNLLEFWPEVSFLDKWGDPQGISKITHAKHVTQSLTHTE